MCVRCNDTHLTLLNVKHKSADGIENSQIATTAENAMTDIMEEVLYAVGWLRKDRA